MPWRRPAALRRPDAWGPAIEDYVDYDLVGKSPQLRSSVAADAVLADSAEQIGDIRGQLDRQLSLITVGRGLLDELPGLYPEEVVRSWQARLPQLEVTRLVGYNHYTVLLSAGGAAEVAARIKELLAGRVRRRGVGRPRASGW